MGDKRAAVKIMKSQSCETMSLLMGFHLHAQTYSILQPNSNEMHIGGLCLLLKSGKCLTLWPPANTANKMDTGNPYKYFSMTFRVT